MQQACRTYSENDFQPLKYNRNPYIIKCHTLQEAMSPAATW